ncbi:c-type cytochrome [Aestuariibacter sp. AA17]|uniref:C-type cytochrome n=1 Tax=Fluctibacter corallii TaxID=2984329 RepID=A0ABT3AAK1_9ALTE|nr:c-type cytochrome [Aestuariibacter sp. AA17]MCV2885704.1 c-type cytochrome [Aestuariibacter sp. AA17]
MRRLSMINSVWVLMIISSFATAKPDSAATGKPNLDVYEKVSHPSMELGAHVFKHRCALCHGPQGMGEGRLAMQIKDYPDTNLRTNIKYPNRAGLEKVIAHGASLAGVSPYMPPMGADISWTELQSVVDFVLLLREDAPKALTFLNDVHIKNETNLLDLGRQVFNTRCTLCHGDYGKGDGRMSKIIKTPPPANLTVSVLPKQYLQDIIEKGGEKVGRSMQMPPWKDQLSEEELESVVEYVYTLRN